MTEFVVVPPRRSLSKKQRAELFSRRQGICGICGLKIIDRDWIAEHLNPRAISADDSKENMWPAHIHCATNKTKKDRKDIAKCDRVLQKHIMKSESRSPMPGGRKSKWKKKMDGTIIAR